MKKQLAILAAFAALSSLGAIRAITPQPADAEWTKSWWMPRHLANLAAATNDGAKVVFLGDSITHFWESNGKAQWAKYFAGG